MVDEQQEQTARVVIPTTGLPAEVIRIERLPAELKHSGFFIEGDSTSARIRKEYEAFVGYVSGVVERLVGHGAFRLDVSAGIDTGDSWKLGVLVAHAYEAVGRLHQRLRPESTPPGLFIWATGNVRSVDLAVSAVGHIEAKLQRTLPLLRDARASGLRCVMLLPRDNLADIPAEGAAELERLGIRVVAVGDAIEAFEALGLPAPQAAAAKAAPHWTGNPYRGLEAYEPEHRAIFFGRGRAREECVELLRNAAGRNRAFLLVHGRSGAGKSSLALAGIAGDVMDRAVEGGEWTLATVRFGSSRSDPVDALARAISTALELDSKRAAEFSGLLAGDPVAAGRSLALRDGRRRTVLLVADQFEQALLAPDTGKSEAGRARAEAEQAATADALGKALLALCESGHVWIVATMRTDALDLLDLSPALGRLARDDRSYRLEQPSLSELSEIITQPAALAGYRFEKGEGRDLPGELAEIAIASPDSLPLLQIVLLRLAELAGPDRVVTHASFRRIGGFDGAVASWAEKTESDLLASGIETAAVDRVLANLIRIEPESGRALSRPAPLAQGNPAAERIVKVLLAARLLVTDGEGEATQLRLAHEMLTRVWDRLRGLVPRLREGLLLRDRLEADAAEWAKAKGDQNALLIRGPARIEAATELMRSGLLDLSRDAVRLVEASQAAASEERRRESRRTRDRFRIVTAVAVVLLAISGWSIYASVVAQQARDEAVVAAQRAENEQERAEAATKVAEGALEAADRQRLEAAVRAAETAALAAPIDVAKGRIDAALRTLVTSAEGLDAAQLPGRFLPSLAQAVEASRFLETYAVPAGVQVLKSGRDVFAYDAGTLELSRFGENGKRVRIDTSPLRRARLANVRLVGDTDLVLVWQDGGTQRLTISGGTYREVWSTPAHVGQLDRATIGAKGDIHLRFADTWREWTVSAAGAAQTIPQIEETYFGLTLPGEGGAFMLLSGETTADPFSAALSALADGGSTSVPLVDKARHDAMVLGKCRGDARAPTAAAASAAAAAIAFSLRDWATPYGDFDCLATRAGILVSPWNDGYENGTRRGLYFITGLGDRVDMLSSVFAHMGLGDEQSGDTDLPLAFDADPKTGLIAIVLGQQGVLMQVSQRPARPTLVARFPAPVNRPIVTILADGRLLVVDGVDGSYRLTDVYGAPATMLETTAQAADWSGLLHPGTCGTSRDGAPALLIYNHDDGSAPTAPASCYAVSPGGLRAEASPGGVEVGGRLSSPEKISTVPARAVFFSDDATLFVANADNTVWQWQRDGTSWISRLVYRSSLVLRSAEPDPSGRYLLIGEESSGSIFHQLYSLDAEATVVPDIHEGTRLQKAHYAADGTIILSGEDMQGGQPVAYRQRLVPIEPLLAEARAWLAQNGGLSPR